MTFPATARQLAALPATGGAREVVRALLAESDAAALRLRTAEDPEALHDFRVGVRRLRSALRAFQPFLTTRRRPQRRLAKIARKTNAARDAEVQLAWLDAHAEELPPLAALRTKLGAEMGSSQLRADSYQALLDRYARISLKIARRLAPEPASEVPTETFGLVVAALAEEHLAKLRAAAGRIRGADDQTRIHRARIAAKRLRYLLEPLGAGSRPAVKALKRLQDDLGELHDRHVLAAELARGGDDEAVLAPAARLVKQELDERYAGFEAALRGGAFEALEAEVAAIAGPLRAESSAG